MGMKTARRSANWLMFFTNWVTASITVGVGMRPANISAPGTMLMISGIQRARKGDIIPKPTKMAATMMKRLVRHCSVISLRRAVM
jgi:hypothetical protein